MKTKTKRRNRLDELAKFRIEALAKGGWFSYRYIASLVFLKPMANISDTERGIVQGHCHRNGIRVTDGRNGLTTLAKHHATGLLSLADKQQKHFGKTRMQKRKA